MSSKTGLRIQSASPHLWSVIAVCILAASIPRAYAVTGSLTATATAVKSTTTINLTTQGTSDWAHWGQSSATDFDQLSGNSQISNITVVGSGSPAQFTDSIQEMSWTNGSPTASATNSQNGIWIAGINNGFSFTAPASTTAQTLTVYVGGWESGGTLTAALSDGSASTYTNNSMSGSATGSDGEHYYATFTFTYNAASSGQTLKISWVENANQDSGGSGNVTLQAVTLAAPQTTATPTFSPAAGTYTGSQTVTISNATSGSTIYYTTNGTAPTTSSTKYTGSLTVSSSETIEAIATASGYGPSSTAQATYTINTASAPTAPTNFTAATTNYMGTATYCTVTMSWEASTSATGISYYSILRNGAALATTSNLSYQDASAAANTTYNYEVEAVNPSGGASVPSTQVSVGTGSCTAGQAFNLGVMYTTSQSTFSLWSPSSSSVELNLNGTLYPMTLMANQPNGYSNVYSVTVSGNLVGETYNFQVNGTTTMDPYGVMSEPGTQYDIVMNPSLTTLSAGWTPRPALANRVDSLVYETHVREFTNDPSSGIPTADRGYFEGMTDTGTTVDGVAGAPSTGIAHLVNMGVTHVQIMPFFEYNDCVSTSEENTCFNWGYDPLNYNIPTSNYSETPTNYTNRVLEIKQMIDNFHKQGIRVIMDVVYNHTTNESVFGNISSDYYLATDITGTGNTINGSNAMVARMIQDSLEYWVTQYNLDGFRFDLLGVFPLSTVNQWGTYLTSMYPDRNLLLYGEPWVDGTPATTALNLGDIGTIPSLHFGAFNGAYRGAIKGTDDNGGGNTGFMFDQSTSDSFFGAYVSGQTWPNTGDAGYGPISLGVAASPVPSLPATANSNVWNPAFSAAPEQSINYISVHDNLCLYDKVTEWQSANGQTGQSTTDSLIAYGFGIVLTSQGIPFMYEGDEFQHSKSDNDNSDTTEYDLVWSNLENNSYDAATYAYVQGLIALRKAHPSLEFTTWSAINSNVQSNQESASLVVTTINAAAAAGETWNQAVIVYNSNPTGQTITLPSDTWYVAVYGQTIEPVGATASSVAGSNTTPTVAPWGMTIFYR
jgi:pullulanase